MNTSNIRACFALSLLIGLWCFLCGLTVDTMMPHFMLDAVLTPDELADEQTRNRTLAILKKANESSTAPYWFGTGVMILIISAIGLRQTNVSHVSP